MTKCQIKWIDENGNFTADDNEAIMLVRTKDRVSQVAGRGVRFTASEWFPICACHAAQLSKPGMEIWESKSI